MTNQEILTKAISKAIDGGWDSFDVTDWFKVYDAGNGRIQVEFRPHIDGMGLFYDYTAIIFNHEFAKALWREPGDHPYIYEVSEHFRSNKPDPWQRSYQLYRWQYHLQMIVISEDPIKYLESTLDAS